MSKFECFNSGFEIMPGMGVGTALEAQPYPQQPHSINLPRAFCWQYKYTVAQQVAAAMQCGGILILNRAVMHDPDGTGPQPAVAHEVAKFDWPVPHEVWDKLADDDSACIDEARKLSKGIRVGCYGAPFDILTPTNLKAETIDKAKDLAARLSFGTANAYIYPGHVTTTATFDQWKVAAAATIKTARDNVYGDQPVYAFVNSNFLIEPYSRLPLATVQKMVKACRDAGAAGIIKWDGWKQSAGAWVRMALDQYAMDVLRMLEDEQK